MSADSEGNNSLGISAFLISGVDRSSVEENRRWPVRTGLSVSHFKTLLAESSKTLNRAKSAGEMKDESFFFGN